MKADYPTDDPPETVEIGGEEYEVSKEGVVDLPGMRELRTLARRHGLNPIILSHDHCSTIIKSGPREGAFCGRLKECPHHS